jgi:uncharacterized membrane protein
MNDDSNRSQLHTLKAELERVELDLRFLRVKAEELESRIIAQETIAPAPAPEPVQAPPPIIVQAPPIIPQPVVEKYFQSAPPPPPPPVDPRPKPAPPAPKRSFEMRLGTFWFVRIGVVMLLTAFVFLGNYAYHHYVGLLSPIGKIIIMYAASAGLLAAGAILPRKNERLKNYSQVLFAGGLAAVYFTTYAAHHFPNLQVIGSAILDGVLLLGWTSFIVWLADRKKSEVLAVFAIGLAYYTALITNVGNFTLISNLLLAIAAVFFLVRNRWLNLTFLSLAASYGSYFYWRYYAGIPGLDEFAGRFSICGYWLIFTAAVFLTRHEIFFGQRRAGFLSFNNGAAFALLTFSFLNEHSGKFWQLSLIAGAILFALTFLAHKTLPTDALTQRAYLAQAIFLTTLGLITKLSGPTLALVLAMESALLLVFSTQWKSRMLGSFAIIVAVLGTGWYLANVDGADPLAWWKAFGMLGLFMFSAFWSGKTKPSADFQAASTYFGALALICWSYATFALAQPHEIAPILALTAIALTALHRPLRVAEITLLAQALFCVAIGQSFFFMAGESTAHAWSPLSIIATCLVAAYLWNRDKSSAPARIFPNLYQSAAAILTLMFVTIHVAPENHFLALAILFAISLGAAMSQLEYIFAPGAFLALAGAGIFLAHWDTAGEHTQNLLAIFVIGVSQVILRRKTEKLSLPETVHNFWMISAAGALWLFASRWVIDHSAGAHFYLTASWALLSFALFGIGFVLRERAYRWAALTVLGAAVARVVFVDVWKLDTIYRILSFLALGVVLLALGYFYTRCQDDIPGEAR